MLKSIKFIVLTMSRTKQIQYEYSDDWNDTDGDGGEQRGNPVETRTIRFMQKQIIKMKLQYLADPFQILISAAKGTGSRKWLACVHSVKTKGHPTWNVCAS